MGTREEFEKLTEIAETIKNGIYYDEKSNSYWSAVGASYVSLARIDGAWYAFQEQQKKIDGVLSFLNGYDTIDIENCVVLRDCVNEIQELLK